MAACSWTVSISTWMDAFGVVIRRQPPLATSHSSTGGRRNGRTGRSATALTSSWSQRVSYLGLATCEFATHSDRLPTHEQRVSASHVSTSRLSGSFDEHRLG